MKKKYYIAGIVITALLIALIAGAVVGIRAYDRKKTQEAIASIEPEILILCSVYNPYGENIATMRYGYFIDKYGNKRYYDITKLYIRETEDYYGYLSEHIEEYEKVPFLKEKEVLAVYRYLNAIDNNAELVEVSAVRGGDVWSCKGYRMSDDGEIERILLQEDGCIVRYMADENAEKIMEIIGKDTWWDWEELLNRFRRAALVGIPGLTEILMMVMD